MEQTRVSIRISKTIANDLEVRSPDEDGCWRGIDTPGVYWLTRQEALQIRADCEYQGNVGGNYIDPVSSGLTRAYRALYKQIGEALLLI